MYANGLPFGIEISTRKWHDGEMIGWAYDYEQHTNHRHPPVLVDHRLLTPSRRNRNRAAGVDVNEVIVRPTAQV